MLRISWTEYKTNVWVRQKIGAQEEGFSNSPFAAPMCSIVNLRMLLSTRFFGGFTIPWGP